MGSAPFRVDYSSVSLQQGAASAFQFQGNWGAWYSEPWVPSFHFADLKPI